MSAPVRSLRGVITVLNTPFRADGSLDLDGLHKHVAYARGAGVAGFLVNGLAAEVDYLEHEERETTLQTVTAAARDLPVIAGLGTASNPDVPGVADRYLSLGCAGLLVSAVGVPDNDLLRILLDLDRLRPGFLMLQDWDATGAGVPVDTLLRFVAQVPSLHWLKIEVADAGPKYSELIARGPTHLRVAGGWAVREMIDGLDRGVHAFMPTALHHTYVRIYNLFAAGQRDKACDVFDRIRPILDFSNQSLDVSITFFKRLLHAEGIYATSRCRAPEARFDASLEQKAQTLIASAISLENWSAR